MTRSKRAGCETDAARALRRLEVAGAVLAPIEPSGARFGVFPDGDRRRRPLARLSAAAVARLLSDGAIAKAGAKGVYALTEAGRARARRDDRARSGGGADAFRAQHQDRASIRLSPEAGAPTVEVDRAESPLAWLARRTDGAGRAWIGPRELAAGERLRSDFHRARFSHRVTSDWTAPPQGSAGRFGGDGLAPCEAALAARDRIRAALAEVGDPLDGLLAAVCGDGRGLDDVERGFGWPRRSAKLVLKIALGRLAGHYGYPSEV